MKKTLLMGVLAASFMCSATNAQASQCPAWDHSVVGFSAETIPQTDCLSFRTEGRWLGCENASIHVQNDCEGTLIFQYPWDCDGEDCRRVPPGTEADRGLHQIPASDDTIVEEEYVAVLEPVEDGGEPEDILIRVQYGRQFEGEPDDGAACTTTPKMPARTNWTAILVLLLLAGVSLHRQARVPNQDE